MSKRTTHNKPGQIIDNAHQPSASHEQPHQTDQYVFANSVARLEKAYAAAQQSQSAQHKQILRVQWGLCIITFLAFLAACVYAWITYLQWADLRVHFAQEQRPYVVATKLTTAGDIMLAASFRGIIEVTNVGRTPAVNFHGCADVAILPNTQPMTDNFVCPAPRGFNRVGSGERSEMIVPPNAPVALATPGTTIALRGSQGEDELAPMLLNGGFRLYIYGDASYSDLIGNGTVHHMTFCGRYDVQTKTFDVCEKHNRID